MKQLISNGSFEAYKYNGVSRSLDVFCAIKDDNNEFLTLFKNIYLTELELSVEHQRNHFSFLDLVNKIENSLFVYKIFKKRDKVSFFIVRTPHLSSKISSIIFYRSIFSKLLKIARCALRINSFIPRAIWFIFNNGSTRWK